MKQTHTHRGHCQLCGLIQAIDPDTSHTAKHGYTVEGGYFQGVCPGSDNPTLHVARDLADKHIASARKEAAACLKAAEGLQARLIHPLRVWGGAYKLVMDYFKTRSQPTASYNGGAISWLKNQEVIIDYNDALPEYKELGRQREIERVTQRAKMCLEYANTLEAAADRITQKVQPFAVADLRLRGFAVGDVVRIGGKKGFDATIEAIEDREYKTRGWCNSSTSRIPHARVTRPATEAVLYKTGYCKGDVMTAARPAKTYWEPLRFLKRKEVQQ
jgi:hypothetical protein